MWPRASKTAKISAEVRDNLCSLTDYFHCKLVMWLLTHVPHLLLWQAERVVSDHLHGKPTLQQSGGVILAVTACRSSTSSSPGRESSFCLQ